MESCGGNVFDAGTPFQCYNAIINGTLQTLEEIYFKALGADPVKPGESRIARDPIGVMADFAKTLQASSVRLVQAKQAITELEIGG